MQRILFVLILLMQIATAHASWNVETKTDSMTDEMRILTQYRHPL